MSRTFLVAATTLAGVVLIAQPIADCLLEIGSSGAMTPSVALEVRGA